MPDELPKADNPVETGNIENEESKKGIQTGADSNSIAKPIVESKEGKAQRGKSKFVKLCKYVYIIGKRSVAINMFRVGIALLLVVFAFFRFFANHDAVISLEASIDKVDRIEAQGIELHSFEADKMVFNRFDAVVISLGMKALVGYNDVQKDTIDYNGVRYDNTYTFVWRPGLSDTTSNLVVNAGTKKIGSWHSIFRSGVSDAFGIPESSKTEERVELTIEREYEDRYFDIEIGEYHNLSLMSNIWGSSYEFFRDEPYNIEWHGGSLDIYKDDELIVTGNDSVNRMEIPSMRGVTISTYGQGRLFLPRVESLDVEFNNPRKIAFTGSGTLQYYYTAEGKKDTFEHYDIELECNGGAKGKLVMYDDKTTKLQISGVADKLIYFGRSLFPSVWEWFRMNAWTLPVSLITIIGAAVSLTKKDP